MLSGDQSCQIFVKQNALDQPCQRHIRLLPRSGWELRPSGLLHPM